MIDDGKRDQPGQTRYETDTVVCAGPAGSQVRHTWVFRSKSNRSLARLGKKFRCRLT